MLGLRQTLDQISQMLSESQVPFALIGAMALSEYEQNRATRDVDLLIPEEFVDQVKTKMLSLGYSLFHQSEEVLQFQGPGMVDFLIARRPVSRGMIASAKEGPKSKLPCVSAEDLIGLKIQAYSNNPKRELQDKADIQALIERNTLDWEKVKFYADHFQQWPAIVGLRKRAGK